MLKIVFGRQPFTPSFFLILTCCISKLGDSNKGSPPPHLATVNPLLFIARWGIVVKKGILGTRYHLEYLVCCHSGVVTVHFDARTQCSHILVVMEASLL